MPKTAPSPPVASRRGPLGAAHRAPVPDGRLLELLDAWLPAQRWYPVKGLTVRHVPWMSFTLSDRCTLHLLRIVGEGVDLVIQVPLVVTSAGLLSDAAVPTTPADGPAPGAPEPDGPRTPMPGLIGFVPGTPGRAEPGATGVPLGTPLAVHDGATHPDLWRSLLESLERAPGPASPPHGGQDGDHAGAGHADEGGARRTEGAPVTLDGARMVGGEQSNSSVILPQFAGGTILKIQIGRAHV